MNGIVSTLFDAVDQMSVLFVVNAYGAINQRFGALFWTVVTIYIVWTGYKTFNGKYNATSFLWLALRLLVICYLATDWNTFYKYIYQIATGLPEDIGNVLLSAVSDSSSGASSISGVQNGLNQINDAAVAAVAKIYKGSIFDVLAAIVAAVVMLCVYIMLALCCAIILSGKIMIGITLSLGPVFIAMALFQYTTKYLDGWITALVSTVTSMVLTYAFLGFYIGLFKKAMNAASIDPSGSVSLPDIADTSPLADYIPLLLISLIGFYVLQEIVQISRTIAGGFMAPDGMARAMGGAAIGYATGKASSAVKGTAGATGGLLGKGIDYLRGKPGDDDNAKGNNQPSDASRAAFEKQLQPDFKGTGSSASQETKT